MVELLKDEFVCEPRGKVEVKGVGEVETWFLVGEVEGRGDAGWLETGGKRAMTTS